MSAGKIAEAWTTTLKTLTRLFSRYEIRVLRGLVDTGDGMSETVKQTVENLEAEKEIPDHLTKHLRHYYRKWDADRSKLK